MKLVRIIFFPVVAAAFGLVFWLKGFEIHAPFGLTFAASFIAAGIIFDQWKRSIFVTGSALGAALIFWNGGITLGIDLAGGGELRYRFDTGDIEAEEAGLLAQKERLEEGGDRTALAARVEDIGEQLRAEGDAEKRAKLDSEKAELEEKIREIRSLEEKIRATRSKKSGHAENALSIIRKRIDPTGMQEMSVQALGADEIIIRIPYRKPEGVDDHREAQRQFSEKIDRIKKLIEKQGVLHFYIVNDKQADWLTKAKEAFEALKPIPNRCLYVAPYKDFMAKSREAFNKGVDLGRLGVISHSEPKGEDVGKPQPPMLLKAGSLADGSIIHYASATLGDEGFQVNMVFTNEGSQVFWDITSKHRGERMAIVLDDMMHSAPNIKEPIRARGRITGNFDPQEASILAEVLTAGSLPMKVKFQSSVIIGPGMGSDSVMKGVRSIAMAGVLVLVFMAVYYLSGGLVADLALLLNLVYILGAMSLFHATLTLPGIAGILLTVGMAVDANILIFERIREEKARGRVLRLAVQAGYDRAFVTIMDAQITTLITAIILYYVGTGPVKGFAVTLMMGIVAGLFTSLYVTRLVIEFLVAKNVMKSLAMLRLIGETALPFVKARFGAFVLSAAVIGVGIWGFVTHEHKYGIDFAGGTRILVEYEAEKGTDEARAHIAAAFEKIAAEAEAAGDPETAKRLRDAVAGTRVNAFESVTFGRSKKFSIVTPLVQEGSGEKGGVETLKRAWLAAAAEVGGKMEFLSVESIGTAVSQELQGQAFQAVLFSLGAIFLYIIARFEFNVAFGAGAVAALAHDVGITVGAICLLDKLNLADVKIDIETVAALLTIVGYSLNDTIVVYDRIRENRRASRSTPWPELVNSSINQTLSRTLLTSATTLFAVLVLFVAGGGRIHGFALALMVGVVVGTYSSIFVASPFVVMWMKRKRAA